MQTRHSDLSLTVSSPIWRANSFSNSRKGKQTAMKKIIYGCAYYDEYMPFDRIDEDIRMMNKAGINTVRIAESTWSTEQPKEDVFDFSSVIKVMDKMEEAGIDVIIGTPTYAVPYWLAHKYPDIMADTSRGKALYGARQLMDISRRILTGKKAFPGVRIKKIWRKNGQRSYLSNKILVMRLRI